MIGAETLEVARQAIAARFDMRDEALRAEIEQLVALVARDSYAQQDGRLGVKARLLCERDLLERAAIAWAALRKAHQDVEGFQRPGLQRELLDQLHAFMREGALRLAASLRERAEDLAHAFTGRGAIDAAWIARQRRNSVERQAQGIEDYVVRLPRNVMRNLTRR